MKTLALLLFILTVFNGYTQQQVDWGKMERSSGRMLSILPKNESDFYSLRWSGGAVLGNYKLSKHSNLSTVASGKLLLKADNGMANFEDSKVINGKLLVFLSDRYEGENHFYMQEYGEDMKPLGEPNKLAKYELERGKSRGFFNVIVSQDNTHFGVVWEIPGKREEKDRYGFKIFNENMEVINEGDYKLPYEGRLSNIDQHYLTNTGDYFISVIEYQESEQKRLFRNYLNYKSTHILHITDEGLEDFEVNLSGKRVEAMSMSSDNQRIFTLTGIYGETGKAGVSGLFYLRADFDRQEIIDEGFEKFGKDFITQDWSDRQKERAERQEQRGKGEPQLYNYVMRQTEVLEDGSIIGSIEQYYVVVSSYTDPRTGATRTTYTYYYNDVIAYKVGKDGGFDWLTKIDKYQVSTNDGGPYSSYARYMNDGKLCFIFNDSDRNYDENGKFLKGSRTYAANFSKRRNVVALVEIDLSNGNVDRKTFFDRSEINALAVPKLFNVNYTKGEVLLYAVYGRNERFGKLKLID